MNSDDVPLALLGFGTTTEVWIRLVRVLLIGLAYYYVQAAPHGLHSWEQSL